MPRHISVLIVAGLALGCGSIITGNHQTVTVTSEPAGAEVRAGQGSIPYWTPASVKLSRRQSYVLTIELPGYTPATVAVERRVQPAIVALDIVATAGTGLVVDLLTGSLYRLAPATASVTLTRAPLTNAGPDSVVVFVRVARDGAVLVGPGAPGLRVGVSRPT